MNAKNNKLIKVWATYSDTLVGSDFPIIEEKMYQVLGNIFCPGPFYFYLFDFVKGDFIYVHPNVQEILGVKGEDLKLDFFTKQIPQEDLRFMQQCEKIAGQFFFDFISLSEVTKYKAMYCYNIRTAMGLNKMILHQGMTYSTDKNGKVHIALGVHTDISHLSCSNPKRISFIHIEDNSLSLYGIDPFIEKFIPIEPGGSTLTNRQIQIVQYLAEGDTDKEMSLKLCISSNTVRTHRNNIRKKLGCRNSAQVVAKAIRLGLI